MEKSMSETIIDYMEKYNDIPFSEMPMNDVDSLALCQLSYLKFDGMVGDARENGPSVTLEEIAECADCEKLFSDERFEKCNRALFEGMLGGRRYRNMKLNCYINIVEKEWETQFSAITFLPEGELPYIAFRGTDETIVGWKEDFNMAFLSPVPAQEYSVKYLHMVASGIHGSFNIGGHSKGGNLAVYCAMNCIPGISERMNKVYSMDGPGFRPEILAACDYERIAHKVVKLLPQSSLIGMLFERDTRYQVVESKSYGLAQHDPFTWRVREGAFVMADALHEGRRFMDDTINQWILSLDEEQLRTFVDTVYQVVCASQADNLIDFVANWKKSINGITTAIKEIDEQTARVLREILKALPAIAKTRAREEATLERRSKAARGKRISRKQKEKEEERPTETCAED